LPRSFLLRHGANVNLRSEREGKTPLLIAVQNGGDEDLRHIIASLIEHGADVEEETDDDGRTPLFVAGSECRSAENVKAGLPDGLNQSLFVLHFD
jgi:ankyrin repeat protein